MGVARDVASKIKPQNEKSNTDKAFGQYVAERLQEMGAEQRSAKRQTIVLLLEDSSYPTSTRRHGNFAGVHTLLRIILSSNSAVLINIITGVSPPHFDFFVFYVLCQC
jgi:hypothetical protein